MDEVKFKSVLYTKRISQNKLAAMIGIDAKTLSNKVTGKTEFKLSEVIEICKALNIEDPKVIFW